MRGRLKCGREKSFRAGSKAREVEAQTKRNRRLESVTSSYEREDATKTSRLVGVAQETLNLAFPKY